MRVEVCVALLVLAGCDGAGAERDGGVIADGSPSNQDARVATDAARLDAAPTDGAMSDAGRPSPDGGSAARVPAFLAQGDMGRTIWSCDDGLHWVGDRSLDDAARCYEDGLDCSHHAGTATGLAFGDGAFYASWGWGAPGRLTRAEGPSSEWMTRYEASILGRALYGNGALVLGGVVFQRSVDEGASFSEAVWTGLLRDNVRRAAFVPTAGGRFVLIADGGGDPGGPVRDIVLSADGLDWQRASDFPDACGREMFYGGGIAGSADTVVVLGGQGTACTSSDAGNTWTAARPTEAEVSFLVHDGTGFSFWERGQRHRSVDGRTWSSEPIVPADLRLGVVAHHPATGTWIGTVESSQYEAQEVYRSTDGVTWQRLSGDAFPTGHALRAIVAGSVPSGACSAL